VWLSPFNRVVYLTTHRATAVDFRRWLPLLALGACEQWYTMTTLGFVTGQSSPTLVLGDNLQTQQFQSVLVPKREGIAAAAAGGGDSFYRDNHYPSSGPMRDRSSAGAALYRVVQSGSREAAASRAFYDAGIHTWSTVFVCAAIVEKFPGFQSLMAQAESYERVDTVEELFEAKGLGCGSVKTRVFY
jgi:hypothetical protein